MKFEISWNKEEILEKVRSKVEEGGWSFSDTHISISWVKVAYKIEWTQVNVQILEKPWLVPESHIERHIIDYFNNF